MLSLIYNDPVVLGADGQDVRSDADALAPSDVSDPGILGVLNADSLLAFIVSLIFSLPIGETLIVLGESDKAQRGQLLFHILKHQ